ncbi:hypothetical protein PHYPSEUDO_011547 [Phytophthora pseudosyringae]|uniref:Uncharacterized protein n=1 Tax=Phytophthora pseudosyringae TaxID=221518 RepID=A0A8T1VB51_9STRA|nr:hypothetical protein PHYPSEUDO_011547 [Phytophthora pseudosyringae]
MGSPTAAKPLLISQTAATYMQKEPTRAAETSTTGRDDDLVSSQQLAPARPRIRLAKRREEEAAAARATDAAHNHDTDTITVEVRRSHLRCQLRVLGLGTTMVKQLKQVPLISKSRGPRIL